MFLGFHPVIPYLYMFASVRRVFQHLYSGKLVVDGIRHELDNALIRVFHNPNADKLQDWECPWHYMCT
jgi:hypothetical protein